MADSAIEKAKEMGSEVVQETKEFAAKTSETVGNITSEITEKGKELLSDKRRF